MFLPNICKSAVSNQKIILNSDGEQYRDFLNLNILLKVVSKILVRVNNIKKNTIFNVSSGKSIKIIEATYKVKKIMRDKFKKEILIIKGKKTKDKIYKVKNNKLENFLKYKINFGIENTIIDIIKFFNKNEKRIS